MRDKFDCKIIELLRLNARLPISELAKQVNLSRTAVTARIKKLEQDQKILGYQAIIQEEQHSDPICAYLAIKLDTSASDSSCQEYASKIGMLPGIVHCYGISGETDLLAHVEVDTMAQLSSIIDQLNTFTDIKQVVTHMVIKQFF